MATQDDITKIFDDLIDITEASEHLLEIMPLGIQESRHYSVLVFFLKQYRSVLDRADSIGLLT